MNFSVVIITRNRLGKLKRAVASVVDKKEVQEIIIVDNNSDHFPLQEFKNEKIVYIRNKFVQGVSENRNRGIHKANGEIVIFLDDDAYIEEIDLIAIKSFFCQNPKIGIIAPKLVYPDGTVQESARTFPTILPLLWRGLKLYKLHMPSWYKKYVNPISSNISNPLTIEWAIGACLIIRKSVFRNVGLFDERYKIVYDDVDFCTRVVRTGYEIIYWPNSRVIHEYTRTSSKIFTKATIQHILSIVRFFRKHGLKRK